jgi:hypothetical protein
MELSKFFKKDPKKAAKDLPKRLAASLNKIPIRKGGQDPIEGKRIQPNTNGLQITAGGTTNLEAAKCRVFPKGLQHQ